MGYDFAKSRSAWICLRNANEPQGHWLHTVHKIMCYPTREARFCRKNVIVTLHLKIMTFNFSSFQSPNRDFRPHNCDFISRQMALYVTVTTLYITMWLSFSQFQIYISKLQLYVSQLPFLWLPVYLTAWFYFWFQTLSHNYIFYWGGKWLLYIPDYFLENHISIYSKKICRESNGCQRFLY